MKTTLFSALSLVVIAAATLTGCGLQDDATGNVPDSGPAPTVDAGPGPGPGPKPTPNNDAGNTTTSGALPDVFKSDRACNFNFAQHYISGAPTGEMTAFNVPFGDAQWKINMADDNSDGYIGFQWTGKFPVGMVAASYKGFQGDPQNPAWAQYGLKENILKMSAKGRTYLYCNWWDASTSKMVDQSADNCEVRFNLDSACNVTPAGNMGNFVAQ